jgi:hypothetical protein
MNKAKLKPWRNVRVGSFTTDAFSASGTPYPVCFESGRYHCGWNDKTVTRSRAPHLATLSCPPLQCSHLPLKCLQGETVTRYRRVTLLAPVSGAVLFIADVLHPIDDLAVERFLNSDMRHRGRRRGAVPVFSPGGNQTTSPGRISSIAPPATSSFCTVRHLVRCRLSSLDASWRLGSGRISTAGTFSILLAIHRIRLRLSSAASWKRADMDAY